MIEVQQEIMFYIWGGIIENIFKSIYCIVPNFLLRKVIYLYTDCLETNVGCILYNSDCYFNLFILYIIIQIFLILEVLVMVILQ